MKNFVTALASALLVAVIVTSLYIFVLSNDYERAPLALFISTFLGMAAVALFNVRQAAVRAGIANTSPAPQAQAGQSTGNRGRGKKTGDAKGGKGARGNRKDGAGNKPANNSSSGGGSAKPAAAPVPDGPRETGTVKWFNRSKGFGFIIRENGEEIFVHHRSIRNSDDSRRSNLRDGQSVNYVVADHAKGQQAEDVVGE